MMGTQFGSSPGSLLRKCSTSNVGLGSKGEILAKSRCFPLWPRKRTQDGHRAMSVSCQQATYALRQIAKLLDHLVSKQEKLVGHRQPQRLRGVEVDR